jgi:hypothetical protein
MLSKQSAMPQRESTRSMPPSALEITAIRKFWPIRSRAARVPGRIWSQFAEFCVFSTSASRTLDVACHEFLEQVRVKRPPEAVIDPASLHALVELFLGSALESLPLLEGRMTIP